MHFDRGTTGWLIFIVASIISPVFLIASLFMPPAYGHDHNHRELDGWFKSLHSKGGAWCCNGDDAEEAEWDTTGGKYRVKIDGQWIDVPDDSIVEGPNRVGGARVWSMHQDGKPAVRCFLPGSLI